MEMIEVKTADLVGPALDWAVAKSIGMAVAHDFCSYFTVEDGTVNLGRAGIEYSPSTDWGQGGPLFDLYDILLGGLTGKPYAVVNKFPNGCGVRQNGPTKLISACRAIVAAKLGETVRVPAALVGGGA